MSESEQLNDLGVIGEGGAAIVIDGKGMPRYVVGDTDENTNAELTPQQVFLGAVFRRMQVDLPWCEDAVEWLGDSLKKQNDQIAVQKLTASPEEQMAALT